jgi:hypothetical protein
MQTPEDPIGPIAIIDDTLLKHIVYDIMTGALLLESDDETLDMMLTQIWEMRDQLHMLGVIIGEA